MWVQYLIPVEIGIYAGRIRGVARKNKYSNMFLDRKQALPIYFKSMRHVLEYCHTYNNNDGTNKDHISDYSYVIITIKKLLHCHACLTLVHYLIM